LKSGSPNLLEPSGPVQACIGIAVQALNVYDYAETIVKHPFRLLYSELYCTSEYNDVPGYFGDITKHPPEIRNISYPAMKVMTKHQKYNDI